VAVTPVTPVASLAKVVFVESRLTVRRPSSVSNHLSHLDSTG
jgi:hypothetical protein